MVAETCPNPTSNFPSGRLPRAIFLDSGGVINDNSRRAPQWVQFMEQYMPKTILGGPGHMWGRSNAILSERLFNSTERPNGWEQLMVESKDFVDFDRRYYQYWIHNSVALMNQFLKEEYEQEIKESKVEKNNGEERIEPKLVQLVLPEAEEEQYKVARDAHLHCTSLVRADYPGAVEAILKLKFEQGFEMYTSSGETSQELELTFRTLGITILADTTTSTTTSDKPGLHAVFKTLYGPDLIGCQKSSSLYYERVFQDSGVDPRDAVVVDDKENILGWAKVHGARTVMISNKDRAGKELKVEVEEKNEEGVVVRKGEVLAVDYQLGSLAELPALMALWKSTKRG
ncbi:hypothetical protein BGX27_010837 [Mortierella sp. AM989]|nr:hypothetical protein BGX27_010837 [Mortierella sp. AM989]